MLDNSTLKLFIEDRIQGTVELRLQEIDLSRNNDAHKIKPASAVHISPVTIWINNKKRPWPQSWAGVGAFVIAQINWYSKS